MAKGQMKARMKCTVEIPVGVWGSGEAVNVDSLTEQVKREGVNIVRKLVEGKGGSVVGTPEVTFVLWDVG